MTVLSIRYGTCLGRHDSFHRSIFFIWERAGYVDAGQRACLLKGSISVRMRFNIDNI